MAVAEETASYSCEESAVDKYAVVRYKDMGRPELYKHLQDLNKQYRSIVNSPQHIKPFLEPGRVVKVFSSVGEYDWGVIADVIHTNKNDEECDETLVTTDTVLQMYVMIHIKKGSHIYTPSPLNENGVLTVLDFDHNAIIRMSAIFVELPPDISFSQEYSDVLQRVKAVVARFPEGLPLINPVTQMHVRDPIFKTCVEMIKEVEHRFETSTDRSKCDPLRKLVELNETRDPQIYERATRPKVSRVPRLYCFALGPGVAYDRATAPRPGSVQAMSKSELETVLRVSGINPTIYTTA